MISLGSEGCGGLKGKLAGKGKVWGCKRNRGTRDWNLDLRGMVLRRLREKPFKIPAWHRSEAENAGDGGGWRNLTGFQRVAKGRGGNRE